MISAAAPGPLSREEMEREEVKQAQNDVAVGVDTKHQTMTGILFPMTQDVELAVNELLSQRVEYVQMSVDVKKEIINLEEKGRCAPSELKTKVPEDQPRYHIFVFRHTHEGDLWNSVGKQKRTALVVNKRNVTRLFEIYTQLWQILLGQDVAKSHFL